jgi:hypothetical protein
MKRRVTFIVVLMFFGTSVFGQDILSVTDGKKLTEVKGKVSMYSKIDLPKKDNLYKFSFFSECGCDQYTILIPSTEDEVVKKLEKIIKKDEVGTTIPILQQDETTYFYFAEGKYYTIVYKDLRSVKNMAKVK